MSSIIGKFFFCALFSVFLFTAQASHVVGGELTYTCLGGNQYDIELRLFRDCVGISLPSSATIEVFSGTGNYLTSFSASSGPASYLNISSPACGTVSPNFCVQTAVYTVSSALLPPSSSGYVLAWQTCCRNLNIANGPANQGATIASTIYPAAQCNSSAKFTHNPPLLVPLNTPVEIDLAASEPDGDSLNYELCSVLDNYPNSPPFTSIPFTAPFSSSYPMPSSPAISLDPVTGKLSGTITQMGNFVVGICVKEYDSNGMLIGEIQRDYQFNVINAWAIFASVSDTVPPLCVGSLTGTAKVNAVGGTPPYSYQWSNGVTTDSNHTLDAGQHWVIVSDGFGCADTVDFTLISRDTISLDIDSVHHNSCFQDTNGAAFFSINGGTPPYRTFLDSTEFFTPDLRGLASGSYSVGVLDSAGCWVQDTFHILAPDSLFLAVDTLKPAYCGVSNGYIHLLAAGGTPPYEISWSNGDSLLSATGLAAGTYSVSVTDANLCSKTLNLNVPGPPPLEVQLDSLQNLVCNGFSTGYAEISLSNAQGLASINWSTGSSGLVADSLPAGPVTIVATDGVGCTDSITFTITQPPPLQLSWDNIQQPSCQKANGYAAVATTGGTPPYQYLWSTNTTASSAANLAPGNYWVQVTDANGCSDTINLNLSNIGFLDIEIDSLRMPLCKGSSDGSAQVNILQGQPPFQYNWSSGIGNAINNNLSAGNGWVVVTDGNNCTDTAAYSLQEPTPLQLSLDSTLRTFCNENNGFASVSASGGTPPYSYSWSNGASTAAAGNLLAGNHTVSVTDANGCADSLSVAVNAQAPPRLTIAIISTPPCHGEKGVVKAQVTGGSAPFEYNWGQGFISIDTAALRGGTYSVTVRDSAGCLDTLSFVIQEPDSITLQVDSLNEPVCHGDLSGEVFFSASGGTPPLRKFIDSTRVWGNSSLSLGAGLYTLTVVDDNNCKTSVPFTIDEPDKLTFGALEISHPRCYREQLGQASVIGSGGIPPYSYFWSNGLEGSVATLPIDTVTLSIRDEAGCTTDTSIAIVAAPQPKYQVKTMPATCPRKPDGSIEILVDEETVEHYILLRDSSIFDGNLDSLTPGHYEITLVDTGLCTTEIPINVKLDRQYEIFFPNAFSPNGDGLNDVFEIKADPLCYDHPELSIYNRWGVEVFRTKRPFEHFWNGQASGQPHGQDTYIWFFTSDYYRNRGEITVIR